MKQDKKKYNCKMCQNTGIAEYVDLNDFSNGIYKIKELPKKKAVCPDCIKEN